MNQQRKPKARTCKVCDGRDRPETVCDRCGGSIHYRCEVSGGNSSQMLCLDCSDQLNAMVSTVAAWEGR